MVGFSQEMRQAQMLSIEKVVRLLAFIDCRCYPKMGSSLRGSVSVSLGAVGFFGLILFSQKYLRKSTLTAAVIGTARSVPRNPPRMSAQNSMEKITVMGCKPTDSPTIFGAVTSELIC